MRQTADDLEASVLAIREEVVLSTLTIVTLMSTVLYAGNMARNLAVGTGLSLLHSGLFVGLLTIYALRRRIGSRTISWLIAALLYLAASGGLFVYGLAGNSAVVFMGFCFVVVSFFGPRGGLIALLLSLGTLSIGGALVVTGLVRLSIDPESFLMSPFSWLSAILTIASIGSVIMLQIARLNTRHMQLLTDQHDLARRDPLTGLANRLALEVVLEQAIAESDRKGEVTAVLLIDLDRFKNINDSLGHQVGDRLLVEAGCRLQECVRGFDTVARLGGDEFVVVLRQLQPLEANAVASRIVDALSAHYTIDGRELHSAPSIGISLCPQDAAEVSKLLRFADSAMYESKARGGGQFQYFAPAMNATATQRLEVENRLRHAIEQDEFRIAYQAKVDMTGALTGFEALIRWQAKEGGLQSPAVFIPIAEESDLINQIGDWVLAEVCRQLHDWRSAGMDPVPVAINLSPRQLRQANLIEKIANTLGRWSLPTSLIEFEITEGAAMENPESSKQLLGELSGLGIKLSIDDFGTGFSSLSRLSALPVSTLKIDRSFVRNIETDAGDRSIAISTIALAHGLGMRVVAEGVETLAQWHFLRDNGCDELQGFLFSRPAPAESASTLLRKRRAEPASA
jgi:diguanylate cyclase (GGDEF)-like protein